MEKCKFCGSSSTKIVKKVIPRTRGERFNVYITCNSCRARGSLKSNEVLAVASWNGYAKNTLLGGLFKEIADV